MAGTKYWYENDLYQKREASDCRAKYIPCFQVNPVVGHDIPHQEDEDKEGWVPRGFDKDGHPLDMSPMIRHDPEVNH